MWTTSHILLLLTLLFLSAGSENSSHSNHSETLNDDVPIKPPKSTVGAKGWDTCSIPCDITVKLLRDEKHSICGQLQQSLLSFGRSTRKLMRDVMEEQQRALDILSTQVTELMTKVQMLSSEVQRSNTEMYAIKPVQSHGRDCSDIKDNLMAVVPKIPSGIYIINPENTESSFEVFCEMDYMGGGWTVMQRRTDGLTDFKRSWADYTDGFGNLAGEHWLGLKKVLQIVSQKDTRFQLHVALVSKDDITSYASYDDFHLDSETLFYGIHLGRYAGSAGDAFRGYDQDQNQDTAPFSASDVDNDGCNPSCSLGNRTVESCSALHNQTGWWFNQCGLANLNGSPEDTESNERTNILWNTWRHNGIPHHIKAVTMKIRRIPTNN
ncbi:angiopoietin-related protein 5 isoform X1 [Periophthalmus magnuspinnatus]|uniref:angiopoietin-related protein 5 isoform X1 n=1 Tax=Periophthalmus magnuspinnatus TaxID=409849 RepID=UPI00145BCE9E|nr:angiopoietin-related protein 5 isoform X1 [Periophthalmus magnuspinnatus]